MLNVCSLLEDTDDGAKEQTFNIVRNLAEDDAGIELVFHELGSDVLLRNILNSLSSADGEVVLQAAYVLANLVNGTKAHQSTILSYPRLLTMLVRTCLTEG